MSQARVWICALALIVSGCRDVKDGANGGPGGGGDGDRIEEGVTVYDVQSDEMAPGTAVTLRGVVVTAFDSFGDSAGSFWVQEPAGGPRSGILVFDPKIKETLQVGDVVDIENGAKKEHAHSTDKNGTVTEVVPAAGGSLEITVVESGSVPAAAVVDPAVLADPAQAEAWEGVLVRLDNARLLDAISCVQSGGNCDMAVDKSWKKSRLTGPFEIQTSLAEFPTAAAPASCFTSVTGIVDYFFTFKILPRETTDFAMAEAGVDTCLAPENSEEACGDNVDNDKNGQADCGDAACQTAAARCAPSIERIQKGEFAVGSKVTLKGVVVTARSADGKTAWIQDPGKDAGALNGLALFNGVKLADTVAIGTVLDVAGTLDEFDHKFDAGGETLTQLKTLTLSNVQPGAGEVRIAKPPSLAIARGEDWEGVLVEFDLLEVTSVLQSADSKFVVSQDGVELQVDDDIVKLEAKPAVGEVFKVVGVMTFNSFAPHNKVTIVARELIKATPPVPPVDGDPLPLPVP